MNILQFIKKETTISAVIFFGFIVTFLSFILFLWNDVSYNSSLKVDSEKLGHLGDLIGGLVGSLWALSGVFLFYKALTEQRKDFQNNKETLDLQVNALNQQIEEFKLSRQEQISSRKVYEEQSKTAKKQQFDSNFYSLLNVYLNIKNNLSTTEPEYFKYITSIIEEAYLVGNDSPTQHSAFIRAYLKNYNLNREVLSRYFRSLYRLIIIIDSNTNFSDADKVFYAKIVRAQLSDYELIILFYNSYTYHGSKTRRLILKYNLLKHLPLLNMPEFISYQEEQGDSQLVFFAEFLTSFLAKHISVFYDVSNEMSKIEEEFEDLQLIVGIYFDEKIHIKIYCQNDLSAHGINLSEEDFSEFILKYMYEKLVFQTYLFDKEITLMKYKTEFDDKKEFCISIDTNELITLNQDTY